MTVGPEPGNISGALTIDLGAIVANWRALDALSAPGVETAAVVKADAYGCGAAPAGRALAMAGVRTFFVALPSEGTALRAAVGASPAIYILGGYPADADPSSPGASDAALYRAHDLRPVLNSAAQAAAWFRDHPDYLCAVQLDTGMNRLGMEADEFASLGRLPPAVRLVMSHLACADEPKHPLNAAQLTQFTNVSSHVGLPRSLAATGAILLGQGYHFDMTRAGVGLYGGQPFAAARAAVSLSLPILQVRDVSTGEAVGYGATWRAKRLSRIATISGGYADGLIRAMASGAKGYINGQPLPFAGRVSMDLITLDVTDCPAARAGTPVEILGPHQGVDTLAKAAGTIGYEILTALGSRYRRRYTEA